MLWTVTTFEYCGLLLHRSRPSKLVCSFVVGVTRVVGGHLMILGAYEPQHNNTEGLSSPWGFLSSWAGKEHLYWMSESDFQRSWGRLSLFNMVTIKRTG